MQRRTALRHSLLLFFCLFVCLVDQTKLAHALRKKKKKNRNASRALFTWTRAHAHSQNNNNNDKKKYTHYNTYMHMCG